MRILLMLAILFLSPPTSRAQPPEAGKGPPATLVVTASVVKESVRSPLTLVGTADPRRLASVATEVEGLVEAFPARQGMTVEKGETLARLRALPVQLQLQEARARLKEVQARMAKARSDVQRVENLDQKGLVSEEELERRRAELRALTQLAGQIRATLEIQQDRLKRMTVQAPFAGQVVEEKTEVGQWLKEGDPVVVLADLSQMHVMVPVPEQNISGIALDDTVEVRFDALPGKTFSGTVSAVIPQADPASRTFPVQVTVPNPQGRILSGMLARVTFFTGAPREKLLIPKDALVPQPGGGGTVVAVREGKSQIVPVKVEGTYGERYAVEPIGEASLSSNDRVVIRGNERLRPGQPVREAPAEGK